MSDYAAQYPINPNAVGDFAARALRQLLNTAQIPEAPASIGYGEDGALQLPDNYPYRQALVRALNTHPDIARELQRLGNLSCYLAEERQIALCAAEISCAQTDEQMRDVLAQVQSLYSYTPPRITLNFNASNGMTILANNQPLKA